MPEINVSLGDFSKKYSKFIEQVHWLNVDIFKICIPLSFRYALKVGEMSSPVYSDSGIHIILRTG